MQVTLLLLKHIFDEDLPKLLPKIFSFIRHLLIEKRTGLQFLEAVLIYLSSSSDKVTNQDLKDTIESTLPEGGDILSTIAQQWIEQGHQQGHQQGLMEAIELGLDLKFGTEGLRILPEIRQIKNTEVLHSIKSGIKSAKTLNDLRKIYQQADL